MTPFQMALLSLIRRRIPTLIALIAIALSVATSGVLLRLYLLSGSRFQTMGLGPDAIVGAKAGGLEILLGSLNGEGAYPGFLPDQLYRSLKAEQTVHFEDGENATPSFIRSITPYLYFAQYRGARVIGTDESFLRRSGANSLQFREGMWAQNPKEVVVGAQFASKEDLHVGNRIEITPYVGGDLSAQKVEVTVVGILEPTFTYWDQCLYADVGFGQFVLSQLQLDGKSIWKNNVLHYFLINLNQAGYPPLESLINRRTVAQAISVEQEKKKLADLTGNGRELGLLISAFIMLLGGLSVAAMLATRFDAMSVQLAVLRAIGFKRSEVGRWLLWEGFVLGVLACGIGAILDAMIFPILCKSLGSALPPQDLLNMPLHQSATVWGAAIFATMFAVFIPLIRLYRQDVHQALKGL